MAEELLNATRTQEVKAPMEFAGVLFTAEEIKTVTIERGGAEIVINRKEPERKMGFGK